MITNHVQNKGPSYIGSSRKKVSSTWRPRIQLLTLIDSKLLNLIRSKKRSLKKIITEGKCNVSKSEDGLFCNKHIKSYYNHN